MGLSTVNRATIPAGPGKAWRFDARLNADQKMLIQRAADISGRTMTDFVLHSAQEAAEETIRRRSMLVLNAQDAAEFVSAILDPAKPGKVLRKAAREYKRATGIA